MKTCKIITIMTCINLVMCYFTYNIAFTRTGITCMKFAHDINKKLRDDTLDLHEKSVDEFMTIYKEYCDNMKNIDYRFEIIRDVLTKHCEILILNDFNDL